jgi:hypothetical protein
MLFEHRRPKKASVSTTIFATRMVTRHIKMNKDPASPSYMSHAARCRDHLYRREDAPLASRRRRFLPAAEAAGSMFFFLFFFLFSRFPASISHKKKPGCIEGATKTCSREAREHTRVVSGMLTSMCGHFPIFQHSALLLQEDPVKARHDTQLTKSITGQASPVRLFGPASR